MPRQASLCPRVSSPESVHTSSHPAVGLPSQGRGRHSWGPRPPVAGRGRETGACPAYHPSKANVVSPLSQPPGPWQRAVGISLAAVHLAVSQRASPGLPPAAGGGRAHPLCVPASPGGRLLVGVCGPLSGPPLPGHWSRESGVRPQGLGWALATGGPRAEVGWARMAWARRLGEHWPQTNCPAGSERFRARLRSHSTAVCTGVTEGVSPAFRISRPAPVAVDTPLAHDLPTRAFLYFIYEREKACTSVGRVPSGLCAEPDLTTPRS